MRTIRTAAVELVGLVVEDGYVAVGALLALAVGYGMTRENMLGPIEIVGWLIVGLVALALLGSLGRAARLHVTRRQDH